MTDSKAAFILFHIYTENPTLTILFLAMSCKFISWSINFIVLASGSFQFKIWSFPSSYVRNACCDRSSFKSFVFLISFLLYSSSILSILSDRFSFTIGPFRTYLWSRMSKATESVISPCTRMWIPRKYVLLRMTSNWLDKWTISYYNNSYYTLHALNILIRKFGSWTCGGNTDTSGHCFRLLPIPQNHRIGQKIASFELVVINRTLYRVTQYWWYNLEEVIAHEK